MKHILIVCLLSTTVLAKKIIPLKRHELLEKRSVENNAAQNDFINKIVGGSAARPGEIPWQASVKKLQFAEGRWTFSHTCGATIISEYWLLSAAHCFKDILALLYQVTVGELSLTMDDQDEQVFDVDSIYNHELFKKETQFDNDIALIKIKPKFDGSGIKFTEMVKNACIPKNGSVESGANLLVSGWGGLQKASLIEMRLGLNKFPDVLQKAVVPLIDQKKCDMLYPKNITDRMFCAGFSNSTIDVCQGDSGGPLVYITGDAVVLLGIVSWGYGCAQSGHLSVYTRVSNFYDCIIQKTALHSDKVEQSGRACIKL